MGLKLIFKMLEQYGGYYDYYDGYGNEQGPKDEKPPMHEMDKKDKKMPPIITAYALVPILEGVSWYVTDDKWGDANNSDWDNVAMSFLAKTVVQTVSLASVMVAPSPATGKMYMNLAGLSAVWGLANGYLLYAAADAASSDSNSTMIASVCTAVSTLVSAGAFQAMGSKGKDWEHWGKKGDKPPKDGEGKDEGKDDYGYGGYDYYG